MKTTADNLQALLDHHLNKVAYYTDEQYSRAVQLHQKFADMLTLLLAEQAKAVPVAFRWRDNVRPGLKWYLTEDADGIKPLRMSGDYVVEDLYTAPQPTPVVEPQGVVTEASAKSDAALSTLRPDRDGERFREIMSPHYLKHPDQMIDLNRYANQFKPDWWMDKENWDVGIDFAIGAAIAANPAAKD